MKILYVENHEVFAANVIRLFLTQHDVTVVPSVARALEARAATTFDMMLVDFDLDDGKGDALADAPEENPCTEYQSSAPYDFDLEAAWSAPVSETIGCVMAEVDSERRVQYGGHVMKPTFTWMMSVGGLLMLAGPVIGMVVTVMGMTRSFEVLGAKRGWRSWAAECGHWGNPGLDRRGDRIWVRWRCLVLVGADWLVRGEETFESAGDRWSH